MSVAEPLEATPAPSPTPVAPAGPDDGVPRRTPVAVRALVGAARFLGRWLASTAVFAVAAFFIVKLIPGDPVEIATGGRLSDEAAQAARGQLGLDDPWTTQLGHYLADLARLDLGTSISTNRPVADDLADRLPTTLQLILLGLGLAVAFALVLSWFVVSRPRNPVSRLMSTYARSAGALPEYVLGVVFVFVFYAQLQWAAAPSGALDPILLPPDPITHVPLLDALLAGRPEVFRSYVDHLVLPLVVLVVAHTAILMKTLIGSLDAAIDEPSTRFRIASGAPYRTIVASIYRRALPPLVVMIGMLFGLFLSGAVVIEALFGLGGLGQYAVSAVTSADVFALRSFLVVVAALSMGVFLLADLVNSIIDPRRQTGIQREEAR
ncbi:ABC transporter permease [Nocardioides sp. C4-1]|uniref:ABC transporter permease n=1 Tax=Nocardioides sp. C4-1 TaxID=3151851 RepID=UPI0032679F91